MKEKFGISPEKKQLGSEQSQAGGEKPLWLRLAMDEDEDVKRQLEDFSSIIRGELKKGAVSGKRADEFKRILSERIPASIRKRKDFKQWMNAVPAQVLLEQFVDFLSPSKSSVEVQDTTPLEDEGRKAENTPQKASLQPHGGADEFDTPEKKPEEERFTREAVAMLERTDSGLSIVYSDQLQTLAESCGVNSFIRAVELLYHHYGLQDAFEQLKSKIKGNAILSKEQALLREFIIMHEPHRPELIEDTRGSGSIIEEENTRKPFEFVQAMEEYRHHANAWREEVRIALSLSDTEKARAVVRAWRGEKDRVKYLYDNLSETEVEEVATFYAGGHGEWVDAVNEFTDALQRYEEIITQTQTQDTHAQAEPVQRDPGGNEDVTQKISEPVPTLNLEDDEGIRSGREGVVEEAGEEPGDTSVNVEESPASLAGEVVEPAQEPAVPSDSPSEPTRTQEIQKAVSAKPIQQPKVEQRVPTQRPSTEAKTRWMPEGGKEVPPAAEYHEAFLRVKKIMDRFGRLDEEALTQEWQEYVSSNERGVQGQVRRTEFRGQLPDKVYEDALKAMGFWDDFAQGLREYFSLTPLDKQESYHELLKKAVEQFYHIRPETVDYEASLLSLPAGFEEVRYYPDLGAIVLRDGVSGYYHFGVPAGEGRWDTVPLPDDVDPNNENDIRALQSIATELVRDNSVTDVHGRSWFKPSVELQGNAGAKYFQVTLDRANTITVPVKDFLDSSIIRSDVRNRDLNNVLTREFLLNDYERVLRRRAEASVYENEQVTRADDNIERAVVDLVLNTPLEGSLSFGDQAKIVALRKRMQKAKVQKVRRSV